MSFSKKEELQLKQASDYFEKELRSSDDFSDPFIARTMRKALKLYNLWPNEMLMESFNDACEEIETKLWNEKVQIEKESAS